jgi:uncharacterized protein involved in response to NO
VNYLMKLNMISILYSLLILIPTELIIQAKGISQLTEWSVIKVSILSHIFILLLFVIGTIFFINITNKWIERRRANFITAILWIPYFICFINLISYILPSNGSNNENPLAQILLIAAAVVFPIYITIINIISFEKDVNVDHHESVFLKRVDS